MTSAGIPPHVAPPVAAPPVQPAWKGAWGGAWTICYGCLMVLSGLFTVVSIVALEVFARWGAASVRTHLPDDADTDVPQRLATLIESAPQAFGSTLLTWTWAGVALSALVVAAGIGVILRSEVARRVAVATVVGSAVLSVALLVWWAVKILPGYEEWLAGASALLEDLQRQSGAKNVPQYFQMLPGRGSQIVQQSVFQVFQLLAVAALTKRLCGPGARAWCGATGQGIATPGNPG